MSRDAEYTSDDSHEAEIIDTALALTAMNKAEIDIQIATARRYPRSIKQFVNEATEMATLDEEMAGECMYALKRDGKTIEGPSARFAEIIASAWGHCRAGARVIAEDDRFVIAQGGFMDLQRNVAITYEVRRRITNKKGQRFSDDMIGVTANAACSIALRNAVFKGIPKAFWKKIYEAARQTAVGNASTLVDRRTKMLGHFQKMGVTEQQVLDLLEVKGVDDIGLDHIAILRGIATSIKEDNLSVDAAFAKPGAEGSQTADLNAKIKAAQEAKLKGTGEPAPLVPEEQPTAADAEPPPTEAAPEPQEAKKTVKVSKAQDPGAHKIQGQHSPWQGQRVDSESREYWIDVMTSADGDVGMTDADRKAINAFVAAGAKEEE